MFSRSVEIIEESAVELMWCGILSRFIAGAYGVHKLKLQMVDFATSPTTFLSCFAV